MPLAGARLSMTADTSTDAATCTSNSEDYALTIECRKLASLQRSLLKSLWTN